jgi:YfiH family protein
LPGSLFLEVAGFPGVRGWRAGFTTLRSGGSLEPILPILGWVGSPIFRLTQRHATQVLVVRPQDSATSTFGEGDGLATSRRGVILVVVSADCVPIVLFDPEHGAGAILHAGWRGTKSRIGREAVSVLRREFLSRPQQLRALLGPSIGRCCYRVGPEVLEAFWGSGYAPEGLVRAVEGSTFLDLQEANRRDLVEAGMDPGRIQRVDRCTSCLPDLFPSYRRDGPGAGRILTFLGSSCDP